MIISTDEFLAHAIAIEREAATRYRELGDQMRAHRNDACAALFDRLARLEEDHAQRLTQRVHGRSLPEIAPWDYQWEDPESPEAAPLESTHYLMTPYHALQLAKANERRAKAFFDREASGGANPEIRTLATEFAAEEAQHIEYISKILRHEPVPEPDWSLDLDQPVEPE